MRVLKDLKIITLSLLFSVLYGSTVSALTAEDTVDIQFTFEPTLLITLSSDQLVIDHLAPGNYSKSNTIDINVQTNNRNGYTLTASVGDSETPTFATNSLVNSVSNTAFTSLASNAALTLDSFSPNYWGYTISSNIDSNTTYSGLLYNDATILNQTVDTSGKSVGYYRGTGLTNFTIGAYAGVDQASGEYTNTISFLLVPNVSTDITIESLRWLQDIAKLNPDQKTSVLNSMTTGQAYELKDTRDNTTYRVAKLADGKIWLLDNLALGGTSAMTLTPDDTNITTNFTLPASTDTGFTVYSPALINANFKNDDVSLALNPNENSKVGVYYNYCAASAGTYCMNGDSGSGNALYDICPAGWRLPTGGESGEYGNLRNAYDSDAAYTNALKTTLSGRYYDNYTQFKGERGYFWSSTLYATYSMHALNVLPSDIYPYYDAYRVNNFSVRCVVDDTKNMQDVTNSELATMLPNASDTVILRDSRDGKRYSVTNVAGLYWMTTNLDLVGGTVLTTEKSNTNYTLPASSTSGFDDNSTAYVYNSGSTTCENNSPCYSYYSWVAATAGGSSNICPKGWRLPTSNEFTALKNVYTTGATLTGSPWYGVYAGRYDNSSFGYGNYGFYWSATAYDTSNAYDLNFLNSNADVGYNGKRNGFSVRCVKAS